MSKNANLTICKNPCMPAASLSNSQVAQYGRVCLQTRIRAKRRRRGVCQVFVSYLRILCSTTTDQNLKPGQSLHSQIIILDLNNLTSLACNLTLPRATAYRTYFTFQTFAFSIFPRLVDRACVDGTLHYKWRRRRRRRETLATIHCSRNNSCQA
jgi:hypothetical protein